jgi:hypothetical protein
VVKKACEMLHGASILYDALDNYKRKQKEKGKSPKNKPKKVKNVPKDPNSK